MNKPPNLIFGIFPGFTGTESEHYHSALETYDPVQTDRALAQLQPPGQPFMVRGYNIYKGGGRVESQTPADVTRYIHSGRQLDCVLCYRSTDGDLDDWKSFIRQTVRAHASHLGALQITEEPNNLDAATGGDGSSPNVRQAIIEGVIAAKDEAQKQNLAIAVGFNATPSRPGDDFWPDMGARNCAAFLASLDYVGFDFFPDVFRRFSPEELPKVVPGVLHGFREVSLAEGGIPSTVPIRITENGWPTTPTRPVERQCEVLETVVRTVHDLRAALNITHYEFFSLRDAKEGNPEELCQFGLLRVDYTPKPAFETYRRLIAELGTPEAAG